MDNVFSFRNANTSTLTTAWGICTTVSVGAPATGLITVRRSIAKPKCGKVEKKVNSTLPISWSHFTYSLATSRTIGVSRSGVNTTHSAEPIITASSIKILPKVMPTIFNAFFITASPFHSFAIFPSL